MNYGAPGPARHHGARWLARYPLGGGRHRAMSRNGAGRLVEEMDDLAAVKAQRPAKRRLMEERFYAAARSSRGANCRRSKPAARHKKI